MAVQQKLYSADDLWDFSRHAEAKQYELSRGELVEMSPTGDAHGLVTLWLGHLIVSYVAEHDLGDVTGAETGFTLSRNPDTVRAPDVGFVSKARLTPITGKFYPIPPDLAVEVVSLNDTAREIRRKAAEYLEAGTRLVWVVYPDQQLVDVFRPGDDIKTFQTEGILDGGDVLPGFKLPVQDCFQRLRK